MKKELHLAVLVGAIITTTTARAEILRGDDCGENCSWSLDTQTGVFIINGEGAMKNYDFSAIPWPRSLIYSVQISDGITSIGNYAFLGSHLTSIDIPNTVTSIRLDAFHGNDFETVVVPDSVTTLNHGAFSGNPNLKEITVSPSQLGADRSRAVSRDTLSDKCAQGQLSPSLCQKAQAYFDKNPDINKYAYNLSIFGDMDISNVLIYCRGEISACHEAMSDLNYGTGPNQKGTYKLAQKQTDGSSKIFESSGKVYYKNKRIFTIDEANAVAGKVNSVKIRYR